MADASPFRLSRKDYEARDDMSQQHIFDGFLLLCVVLCYSCFLNMHCSNLGTNTNQMMNETTKMIVTRPLDFTSSYVVAGTSIALNGAVWYVYGVMEDELLNANGNVEALDSMKQLGNLFTYIHPLVASFDILMFWFNDTLVIYKSLNVLGIILALWIASLHVALCFQYRKHNKSMVEYLNKRIRGEKDDPEDYEWSIEEQILENLRAVGII